MVLVVSRIELTVANTDLSIYLATTICTFFIKSRKCIRCCYAQFLVNEKEIARSIISLAGWAKERVAQGRWRERQHKLRFCVPCQL